MNKEILNKFSKNLFWDADIQELDVEKHAAFIIGRVLDYGRWEDWLYIRDKLYGIERIKEIALNLRSLERKSLSFIATITNTPENLFRCYTQLQSNTTHWYF
ncbi:hypothetical protein MASR2M117_11770 [Paludibacter sp.]